MSQISAKQDMSGKKISHTNQASQYFCNAELVRGLWLTQQRGMFMSHDGFEIWGSQDRSVEAPTGSLDSGAVSFQGMLIGK